MEKIVFKKISRIFPIIGIILLFYMIFNIGYEKIISTFLSIPIYYYLLALLIFIPRIILFAVKWQYISKKQKMDFSLLYLLKISLISIFYGSVTPGNVGLHSRIFYLKEKSKSSLEKCISNSFIMCAVAFLSGLFLSFVGTIILIEYIPGLTFTILFTFVIYLAVFILFMRKKVGKKIFNLFIKPIIPEKFKESLEKSIDTLYEDLPLLKDMFVPFVLEIIVLILIATQVYVISLAFSIDIPFHIFILMSITSVVIGYAIPVTVGGLGVREGAFVYLITHFDITEEIAIVISLAGFIVNTLIPGIVGWIISLKMKN